MECSLFLRRLPEPQIKSLAARRIKSITETDPWCPESECISIPVADFGCQMNVSCNTTGPNQTVNLRIVSIHALKALEDRGVLMIDHADCFS